MPESTYETRLAAMGYQYDGHPRSHPGVEAWSKRERGVMVLSIRRIQTEALDKSITHFWSLDAISLDSLGKQLRDTVTVNLNYQCWDEEKFLTTLSGTEPKLKAVLATFTTLVTGTEGGRDV